MIEDEYFYLSDNKALSNGVKYSLIIDLDSSTISRINDPARRIIELGEKGLRIREVVDELKSEIEMSDILFFINKLSFQGIIQISTEPKPQCEMASYAPELKFLWMELTSKCNLRCIHCYAEAESNQNSGLPMEDLERVIDEAANLGCRQIQFTGGECTLRDDLAQLIMHAKSNGFDFIEIFTNGTMLTESMIKFFAREDINIAMSLYSYKAETHDAITRVPGSYAETINSLKYLLAYDIPVRCETIAMRHNEGDLEATSYFLHQLGVRCRSPDPVRPSGRGKSKENWSQLYDIRTTQLQPNFLVNKDIYKRNRYWNSCWFGKAAVTSSGDVLPCIFARDLVVGNVKKHSLDNIIMGDAMQGLWSINGDKIETCKDCEYNCICYDCRPWAYGITGNLYAKSPRCTYNPYKGDWENRVCFKSDD
jgi:radical SAM protein with 4Fe4S-binding SPASM domain